MFDTLIWQESVCSLLTGSPSLPTVSVKALSQRERQVGVTRSRGGEASRVLLSPPHLTDAVGCACPELLLRSLADCPHLCGLLISSWFHETSWAAEAECPSPTAQLSLLTDRLLYLCWRWRSWQKTGGLRRTLERLRGSVAGIWCPRSQAAAARNTDNSGPRDW